MGHIALEPLQSDAIIECLVHSSVKEMLKIEVFSQVDSTNTYLLNKASDHEKISVCLAEQQTQGRGRYGHEWVSPAGVNVYLSMLWPVHDGKKHYDVLSLWLLLAIMEVLNAYDIGQAQLKWPNDICVQNKKLAGILLERKTVRGKVKLVIGVGLNVAMSLKKSTRPETPWIDLQTIKPDCEKSRNEIAADMLVSLYDTLCDFDQEQLENLSDKWAAYDMLSGRNIMFFNNSRVRRGCVIGISHLGNLIVNIDGEIEHFHSAHVREIRLI